MSDTTSTDLSVTGQCDCQCNCCKNVSRLEKRIDELESELESVKEDQDDPNHIEEVEEQVDEVEEQVDSLDEDTTRLSKELADTNRRLSDVEDSISQDNTPTPEADKPTVHSTIETPLEQICALPQEVAEKELSVNQEKARFLSMDVTDYATRVPAGYSLKSSDIRKVLKAKEGESQHPQTIDRVVKFLKEFAGEDDIKIIKRHGERRVIFTDDLVSRLNEVKDITVSVSQSKQLTVI